MTDPADPQDPENRAGGWYELAIELEGPDADDAHAVLGELFDLAESESVPGGEVVRLPDGSRVVCTGYSYEDGDSTWVSFGLPLGSLARADPRVGAYPFDASDTGTSWRPALDAWLALLAVRLHEVHPFSLALVGMEPSGELTAAQVAATGVPATHSRFGIVTVTGGVTYHPATPPHASGPSTGADRRGSEGGHRRTWTSWWRRSSG